MSDRKLVSGKNLLKAAVCALTVIVAGLAAPAQAQSAGSITYNVNQTIGSGTVTGQIVTDGHAGALGETDITSWNLVLKSGNATTTLTRANSQLVVSGADLVGSSSRLTFNYSGTDNGVVLFQKNLYSGQEYYCAQAAAGPCYQGASIIPGSYNDANAAHGPLAGVIVIGTSAILIPADSIDFSFIRLADARFAQMIDTLTMMEILLGLNEQVSCGDCGGGDVVFGSLALSTHGRVALTDSLTLLGGISVGKQGHGDATVPLSTGGAVALRYDPAGSGHARLFFEVGGSGSYKKMTFLRRYDTAQASMVTASKTHGHDFSAYARVGWVDRLSKRDELAFSASVTGVWQGVAGYREDTTAASNPFPAVVPGGTDRMAIASLDAQYTHLLRRVLGMPVELNLNAGINRVFSQRSGISGHVADLTFDPKRPNITYGQLGGRLGIRLARFVTLDLFVDATLAPRAIGSAAHGGFGFRTMF